MISNYWDELNPKNTPTNEIHDQLLSEMGIPEWMVIKCPFCGEEQKLSSIRSFGVKLNPRNVCDIFIEICCYKCLQMDTVYFRDEIVSIPDFINFLNGTKKPKSDPVIEETMYKMKYNNMIEKVLKKIKEAKSIGEKLNGNT